MRRDLLHPHVLAPARADELPRIRELLRAYQLELGIDLCFQGFEAEVAGLPGAYAPPAGALLLLRIGGEPAGCVAVRAAGDGAELKRLYLAPAHRGRGLGRQLACAAIDAARAAGHRTLRLDTLATMAAAAGLYRALGFREVSPPGPPPVGGMRYFELPLESA